MKRVSLAALATLALLSAAACQDAVTSPQLGTDSNLRYGASNPPPPPIETVASGSFCCIADALSIQQSLGSGASFSIQQSSGFLPSVSKRPSGFRPSFSVQGSTLGGPAFTVQPGCTFTVPVTVMFNKEDNSGYVHFSDDSDNAVESSSNGMVKFAHDDFSGGGTLEIQMDCGLLVIDLSSIEQSSIFNDFEFTLNFGDALLYPCGNTGCTPTDGSATMSAFYGED